MLYLKNKVQRKKRILKILFSRINFNFLVLYALLGFFFYYIFLKMKQYLKQNIVHASL